MFRGMVLPGALKKLFQWIESNGFYEDSFEGRFGSLFDEEAVEPETDEEQFGGTEITFGSQHSTDYISSLLGHSREQILQRLCVIALTGMDGSHAAIWLDDDGQQHIVHIGSGAGSGLLCVLATDAVDFLRLLAIGYREICWPEEFAHAPNANDPDVLTHPNVDFQRWVRDTFETTIPDTALEIIKNPSSMHSSESNDPFWQWFKKNSE